MRKVTLAFVMALALVLATELYGAPGTGTLFGTDAASGNLIRVNHLTGAGTIVGYIRDSVPSLAVDPGSGVVYAGGGAGEPYIYTVDSGSGAGTLVGDTGLGFAAVAGMDFSSDGTLYAAVNIAGDGGTGADHLAMIDKATGAATLIGPFGTCTGVEVPSSGLGSCTIEGIEGIAFDASGTLWGSHSARGAAGAPGLYTIDPATGAATFVAPILDASGAPPSGGVVSLQFACDGTLYGGTARAVSPATDGGRLITIDAATGHFAFVGAATATGGSSLGALAFQDPCVISVEIDVKPGSDPNSINCNDGDRVIAVAILTTEGFDATTVDHTTVAFEGASETHVNRKSGVPRRHEKDVDEDGDIDLVFHFRLGETDLVCESTEGTLMGETFDGQAIEGTDAVRMIDRGGSP